jgi:phage tail sheath gpL-like
MSLPFANIPANLRVPLFYAELDANRANTAQVAQRGLLIGPMTSAGTFEPDAPVVLTSLAAARTGAGAGSVLALMAEAWRANDPFGEVWMLPVADDGDAVSADGEIEITGTATVAGVLSLYVGGKRVPVAVTSGMTATAAGAALAAAVTADADLPITAVNDAGTVTTTAKNGGTTGNDIDLRLNYLGAAGGEVIPAGLGVTITAMSNGATNPVLTTALASLVDDEFDFIVLPFNDATSVADLKALLSDATGRWSWETQVYGHVFRAYRADAGALLTYGATQNDQHSTVMGVYDSPAPPWIWAAEVAAQAAVSLRLDPARPLQTLALQGPLAKAPPLSSRFSLSTRNSLLFKGISTFTVDRDGTVRIENLITTYQTNAGGQADDSYLQVETLFTLAYLLRFLRGRVVDRYSRVKLARDGTAFAPGSGIVTPNIVRADLIAAYRELEFAGIVQDAEAFAAGLTVEINSANKSRLDVLYPAELINGLRVFATLVQFR